MKYIKVKKGAYIYTEASQVQELTLQSTAQIYSDRAFGVDRVDKCPLSGEGRFYLLDDSGLSVFGWVYEDSIEGKL